MQPGSCVCRADHPRGDPAPGGRRGRGAQEHLRPFPLTSSTIKRNGRHCINFTRIAVVVLNQKVRPFTAKWHLRMVAGDLMDTDKKQFHEELHRLQMDLRNYTRLLADLADVEDLTDLEDV